MKFTNSTFALFYNKALRINFYEGWLV